MALMSQDSKNRFLALFFVPKSFTKHHRNNLLIVSGFYKHDTTIGILDSLLRRNLFLGVTKFPYQSSANLS